MTTNSNSMTGTQVVADINVQSCAPATGRQGQSQWQITADVPWSRYPERFWVDAAAGAQPIATGPHRCAFSIGNQKANTTGQAAFHYRFRLDAVDFVGGAYPDVMALNFAGVAPTQNAPASGGTMNAPTYTPARTDREPSIIRQSSIKAVMDARISAYKNATNMVLNGIIVPEELSNQAEMMVHDIVGGMDIWVEHVVLLVDEPVVEQPPQATNTPTGEPELFEDEQQ